MNYQNLKKVAFTATFMVASLATGILAPVSAQTPVCVPGPYDICPPNTDVIIGGVHISDAAIVGLIAIYVVGMILLINGSVLSSKLKTLKNRK